MPETKHHTKGYIWASEVALSVKALATKSELSLTLRMHMVELILINCLLTCTHVPLYNCAYIHTYNHTYIQHKKYYKFL